MPWAWMLPICSTTRNGEGVDFTPPTTVQLRAEGGAGRVADRLQRSETKLAGRLRYAKGGGAIGRDKFPNPISQPPSVELLDRARHVGRTASCG